jgi:hypothetical protein
MFTLITVSPAAEVPPVFPCFAGPRRKKPWVLIREGVYGDGKGIIVSQIEIKKFTYVAKLPPSLFENPKGYEHVATKTGAS